MSSGRSFDLTAGVVLSVLGSVLVLLPENIYDLILNLALFIGFFNTIYQLVQYILKKICRISCLACCLWHLWSFSPDGRNSLNGLSG